MTGKAAGEQVLVEGGEGRYYLTGKCVCERGTERILLIECVMCTHYTVYHYTVYPLHGT